MRDRRNGSLGKQAYEILQNRILLGEYPPGSVLSKRRLAADLQMSAPPITEALKRLESEGLLKTVPRIGAKVTLPSPTEVRRILEVREALECQTARLCSARATAAQKQELEQLARDLDELTVRTPPDAEQFATRFRKADRELHLKLAEYSDSDRLLELLRQTLTAYQGLANLVPVRHQSGRTPGMHDRLMSTVLHGQPEEAEQAMRAHVQDALANLLVGLQDFMVWDEKRLVHVWNAS